MNKLEPCPTNLPDLPPSLLHLPAWQWPRSLLLAGRWMQADCDLCGGEGQIQGPHWRYACPGCVQAVREHVRRSGGVKEWQRYREADLSTFNWSRLSGTSQQVLQRYAEAIDSHLDSGWGLILTGAVGSGKTHVALGLAILALGIGASAYVTTLGELLLSIRSSYQREVERSEAELLEHVCTVELLVLDDLGIEKPTEWAKERLAYIVNRRYSQQRATLVTTNLALDELEKRWDGRVMSRLYGSCQAVGFSSVADYRRVQRQEYLEVVATL